jgi:predicted nucleic acid-binding protein
MLNVVIDTNVLVAGLRSRRGTAFQLMLRIGTNAFRVNISIALAVEYEEVLKRGSVVPGLSEAEVDVFLTTF